MKNKKFILRTFHTAIKVDEDELPKIFEALKTGDVKILRQGWFNPSTFDSVVPDEEWMKTFRIENRHEEELTAYPPYSDLFADIRNDVLKLAGGKKILGTGQ